MDTTDDSVGMHVRDRRPMRHALFVVAALALPLGSRPAQSELVLPYETDRNVVPGNAIDPLVEAKLAEEGIPPANVCSDEVFVRRVYLDMIGTLPEPREARRFTEARRPDKRATLIESLFQREEFADYWSLKWCDLLRVKAEFPINLWPNAVQAYHRWIHDAVRDNMPYDEFARELLTASGSNFRVPPVNFYRAIQGQEPSAIAQAVALTFMGARIEQWPEEQRANLEMVFSRVAYKATAEWKEEIVCLDPSLTGPLDVVFPDGVAMQIPPDEDPRRMFTAWLIAPDNPWFARAMVNRAWAWLLDRGIIHEPDDIRPDNPPSNPELLAYLEREFVRSGYDLRHVFRLILNSRTYQQSSIPQSDRPEAESLFACYPVRRLDAEVLVDALNTICGGPGERYSSTIPEPYTFIPTTQRTIALADGSISSAFLEMFGRPTRDTGLFSERNNHPTDGQRLHFLNSTHIQNKIERSVRLRRIMASNRRRPRRAIAGFYLLILSRLPTDEEMAAVESYAQTQDLKPMSLACDVAWSLINTKEFLYRH